MHNAGYAYTLIQKTEYKLEDIFKLLHVKFGEKFPFN